MHHNSTRSTCPSFKICLVLTNNGKPPMLLTARVNHYWASSFFSPLHFQFKVLLPFSTWMNTMSTIGSETSMQYLTFLITLRLPCGSYTSRLATSCLDKREQTLPTFEWTLQSHMRCSHRNASNVWETD